MENSNVIPIKQKIILNLIREKYPISRIELQRITGIRLATITSITKELIKTGNILEGDTEPKGGKLKKKVLYLNKDLYFVVGIDINHDRIISVMTNLEGSILDRSEKEITPNTDKHNILSEISMLLEKYILSYGKEKMLGIGISCPATLDKDKSATLLSSTIEQLSNITIKPEIEKTFEIPVHLDSSNNLYLLAEKWFGCARESEDVIYVVLGMGIASSIISNGNFIKGYYGIEGELGHTVVDSSGKICVCGNRGCLETVASSGIIEKRIKDLLEQGTYSIIREYVIGDISKVDIHIISKAAEAGDKLALNVLEEAAKYIGISIANLVNIIGPKIVIFGGEAISQTDFFARLIIKVVKANTMSYICNELEFKVSDMTSVGGALGAVALVLDHYFSCSKLKKYNYIE
jgi:Transcriptional regulator/sugar kinase